MNSIHGLILNTKWSKENEFLQKNSKKLEVSSEKNPKNRIKIFCNKIKQNYQQRGKNELAALENCFDFGISSCARNFLRFDLRQKMIDNPIEWFQTKTAELENDLKRKGALIEIKSMVLNSDKKVLSDVVHNVSVNAVFECLPRCEEQDVELACVIITELLSEMTANELLESYGESIHRCLSHPSDRVKEAVLKLLEKNVDENTSGALMNQHVPLLVDATACIASENRSTAQGAISLLIKLGINTEGLSILYSKEILSKLKEVMVSSDTARFRVYEIIVSVSKISQENLSQGISSGLLEKLLSEISSPDILIQLNALELLSSLVSSNHGLTYLQEHAVIENLVDKLLKLNEEPLSAILLPGLIEFFGNLCALCPEHFTNEYPQIMDLLFNSVDTNDEILLGVIITTVGKIGSTQSGRLVLNKYKNQLRNSFFKKIGQILSTKNNVTISAMNCLCELVKNIDGDVNLNEIAREWFQSITPNALDNIVKLTKLPFVECRLAGFALLKTLSGQQWGTEKLCNYPGMIEFLTDRASEFNKDCKQMKFEVVAGMVQCSNIEKLVSQQVLLNLRTYVREGPFYVPMQNEMATEGAE